MILGALVLAFLLSLSTAQVPLGGEGGVSVEVDIDPCEGVECPEGEECEVVESELLLQLPIAHCIEDPSYDPPGPCVKYTVSTNVLSCKSLEKWEQIGVRQCSLRGEVDISDLRGTEVRHACHSLHHQTGSRFLSASFTCCPADYQEGEEEEEKEEEVVEEEEEDEEEKKEQEEEAPTPPPPTTVPLVTIATTTICPTTESPEAEEGTPVFILGEGEGEEEEEEEGDKEEEQKTHMSYVVPLVVGTIAIIVAILVLYTVFRRRQRLYTKSPRLTFIVNPSCEEWEGEGQGESWNEPHTTDTSPIIKNDFNSQGQ